MDEIDTTSDEPPNRGLDLRPETDSCYKCSVCDTNCPVAEVDEEFPGPKFQGPEQWRLKRKKDVDIDESVMKCSNCMRCDHSCPAGVPLEEMHNTARGIYMENQVPSYSRKYIRAKLLANYGSLAGYASTYPRLANFLMNNRVTRYLNEKILGITSKREFPRFAEETLIEWWRDRETASSEDKEKKVAYFHGDYANYNTPRVGKALVELYEYLGYQVVIPEQRCSGTPMFANGMMSDAENAMEFNIESLAEAIRGGCDVICSCTSCSMALRQEYPSLSSHPDANLVAENTYDSVEYLRLKEDIESVIENETDGNGDGSYSYHAPCHARNQGLGSQTPDVFRDTEIDVIDVGDSCSGISGTYGWKSENYEASMEIGEEMFREMRDVNSDNGLTECPTCAMQMEHGTNQETRHTIELIRDILLE